MQRLLDTAIHDAGHFLGHKATEKVGHQGKRYEHDYNAKAIEQVKRLIRENYEG